jgi:hypothetical protein
MAKEYLSIISGALLMAALAYPFARLVNFASNVITQL